MSSTRFEFDRDKVLRNVRLSILQYAVEDDHALSILDKIAQLIRASEQKCERAATVTAHDADYADAICEEEGESVEEAVGIAFLILQMKIRRVAEAAKHFLPRRDIMRCGGNYRTYPHSLVQLIWDVANYYKHRDEWSPAIWQRELKQKNPQLYKNLKGQIKTREVVECLGITRSSSGNMRNALEGLGISPYSACKSLDSHIRIWAKEILRVVKSTVPAKESNL